jgi:hypothetical protein
VRIDRGQGYIFVHVPKTGGQSVSRALGEKTREVPTHSPLHLHSNDDLFSFGFIRNPWDRMVSLYSFLCQKPFKATDNFKQDQVRAAGFKSWLMDDEFYMKEDFRLPEGESWVVGGQGDLPPMQRRPQLWWLDGADYIGKFETLTFDFHYICNRIGIKASKLPHINRTKHKHYRDYYDSETRDFVATHFASDIEYFRYEF